jgi:uncharacterized damage-inducible protein DinB
MSAQDLALSFGLSNAALESNLAEIDDAMALRLPPEGGNSINWILGHVVASRRGLTEMLGVSPPIPSEEMSAYGRGQDGRRLESPLELEVLRAYLTSSCSALQSALGDASAEQLAAPHGIDRMPLKALPSLGGMATFLLFHEGYHAGQIGLLRRIFGLEGRIG